MTLYNEQATIMAMYNDNKQNMMRDESKSTVKENYVDGVAYSRITKCNTT